jgi:pyruvate dehydrogenase E2 component (dihydrolipoyllysine-residue acetyltransferase)
MPTEVIMPALEMAQETGRIVRWLRAEGDEVTKGEPLMEIETDKVTVEIEAPANGTLAGIRASEGDDVPVGEPVAFLLAPGEEVPELAPVAAGAPAAEAAEAEPSTASNNLLLGERARRPLASPKARRIAAERGVDLDAIAGTGPHGAVVASDLAGAAAAPEPASNKLLLGPIWRRMAERTTRSWQSAPHFFLVREVDASRLGGWRDSLRRREGYEGVTHTDLLVKLSAAALREHPRVNASWRDGELAASDDVNVGIAVAIEDGLVVPVVHGADALGIDEIAARRAELVAAAREGRLAPKDVRGGTFTISNLGMYGVDAFLAIVNEPQAAILAVGRIADRVVALDGRPEVRPTLILSLSFDHRVVDGARGAEFLDTLATLAEEPAGLVR